MTYTPLQDPVNQKRTLWSRILDTLKVDVIHSWRSLWTTSSVSIVIILSLTLGIGANLAIFQLINAICLRELPVTAADRLANIAVENPGNRRGRFVWEYGNVTSDIWNQLRLQQVGFQDIAAWSALPARLGNGEETGFANTLLVSGDFFKVLNINPVAGRLIEPSDDYPGCGARVAVLSYPYWNREFAGRTNIVGTHITLERHTYEVVGITPSYFQGLDVGRTFDAAVPLCSEPSINEPQSWTQSPITWWLAVIGRLKPGWTLTKASSHLRAISPELFSTTAPPVYDAESRQKYTHFVLGATSAKSGVSEVREQYREPLTILLALSVAVLLIACGNIACVMLAKTTRQQRDVSIRRAIGASTFSLVRRMAVESVMVSLLGAGCGLLLAQILSRALIASLATQESKIVVGLALDWRVLIFIIISVACMSILIGIMPAIRTAREMGDGVLRAGGRGITVSKRPLMASYALITLQVALAMMLIVVALLFVRTLTNLIQSNGGMKAQDVIVTGADVSSLRIPEGSRLNYERNLLAIIRNVPGVESAATAQLPPLSGRGWNSVVRADSGSAEGVVANFAAIGSGYVETMRMNLMAGRDFNNDDVPTSNRVAIVNASFARELYPSANPIGREFDVKWGERQELRHYQIIGLVADTKYADIHDPLSPIVFIADSQEHSPDQYFTFVIRTAIPYRAMVRTISNNMHIYNSGVILDFSSLTERIRDEMQRERVMNNLLSYFGALSVVLVVVGLYGVVSNTVARRRQEIGIRLALGATKKSILFLVVSKIITAVAIGVGCGCVLALFAGRVMSSLLYGIHAYDLMTIVLCIMLLTVVSFVGGFFPARRATTVNPVDVLRQE